MQRQPFSPRTKGPYHKAVGFAESGRGSRSGDPQDETPVLTELTKELESVLAGKDRRIGTDITHEHKGESNLIGNRHLLKTLRELESIRALRGVNSRGIKDVGVGHPPRNRVKRDPEKTIIAVSYTHLTLPTKRIV